MSIGTPTLLRAASANAATVTTASFTPTAGALLIVDYGGRAVGVDPGASTVSGGGLTWAPAYTDIRGAGGTGNRIQLTGWTATAPASPSAMTVTCGATSCNRSIVAVREVTGAQATTNADTDINGAGRPTISLATAPATDSIVLASLVVTGAAVTPTTGFTETSETLLGTDFVLQTEHDAASPAPATWTWPTVTGNQGCVGAGIEIAPSTAASSGGFTETLSLSDSVGLVGVDTTVGFTDGSAAADSVGSLQTGSTTSPENPAGVWTAATAAWKAVTGADSKGTNNLTASGVTATTLNGPAGQFLTTSAMRRDAPTFAALRVMSVETWVQPSAFGRICRIGPKTVTPANWWELPIRSGRRWASGTAYWFQTPDNFLSAEEADVALLDAGTGSSVGLKSGGNGGANVTDWDGVIGGAVAAAMDSTNTQMDWNADVSYGFGDVVAQLPTGGSWATDGSGWLVWVVNTIPSSRRTDGGDATIWDEIIAGTHDAKYVKWGQRIVAKMAAVGHPLKRLLIDTNHEMNISNIYQVFAGTRTKYKQAMERTIDKMREGAGQHLRFVHRPAYRGNIGSYLSYAPSNCDVLSLSIHPVSDCNSTANVTKLFNGTLNTDYYGITTDLYAAADSMGLPIAFTEWSPKFEAGTGCPVAKTFIEKFYTDILVPQKARLVCDCIYKENVRDTSGYLDGEPGATQWAAMVPRRKELWAGIKS